MSDATPTELGADPTRPFVEYRETPIRFRKKPVEIEAMHFSSRSNGPRIARWIAENGGSCEFSYAAPQIEGSTVVSLGHCYLEIETLEGAMRARTGDWIIRGVKGEFYPCKHDIFTTTYEAVVDE